MPQKLPPASHAVCITVSGFLFLIFTERVLIKYLNPFDDKRLLKNIYPKKVPQQLQKISERIFYVTGRCWIFPGIALTKESHPIREASLFLSGNKGVLQFLQL